MTDITLLDSESDWVRAACNRIRDGLAGGGPTHLAVCGGSTPKPVFQALAREGLGGDRAVITLTDERFVPPSDARSNEAMVRATLIDGALAGSDLIGLWSEGTLEDAAARADARLSALGGRLDVALIGMGEDGHILSMFPGHPDLPALIDAEAPPGCAGVEVATPMPDVARLSLNMGWMMRAGRVVLITRGRTKRRVLEAELAGKPASRPLAALRAGLKRTGAPLICLHLDEE
ncbi:MAG: 6-phosphogluconolactonase [Brevundimonas sp.]|uniref:6-phosphogluconolactonase n=1 Tax=Brevundimonas sp. TaxID=1871086 RepID=UPI00391A12CD